MKTNLKHIRKTKGLTQEQVSQITNIPLGTLRRWEQGVNEPDMESIIKLAHLYAVSTDTILGSSFGVELDSIKPTLDNLTVDVPIYGSIAAGTPIEMIETDSTFPLPKEIYEKYPDAFLLKVQGDSMNRILPNGCYALIDPCTIVERDNQPYAICVNGHDATIKRVRVLNNGFELIPDSTDPTYKPRVFDYGEKGTEVITVIGRVVYHVLPFDWSY